MIFLEQGRDGLQEIITAATAESAVSRILFMLKNQSPNVPFDSFVGEAVRLEEVVFGPQVRLKIGAVS